MQRLFCFLVVLILAVSHAETACHLSFEESQLPLGATLSFHQAGEVPVFSGDVPSAQLWDGGTLSVLLADNKGSMYFGKTPVTSLAPVGGELRFAGADGAFRQPSLTVEAFVRVDEHMPRFSLIASKRRAGDGASWSLSITPDGVFSVRLDTQTGTSRSGFNRTVSSGTEVNDGLWHHVAMTYNHATRECIVYVDYRLCRKATTSGPLVYDDAELAIGRGLNGWIDELCISDVALHQEQFLRLTKFFTDAQKQQKGNPGVMLDLSPTRVQTGLALDWEKVGTLKPKSLDEIPGDFWSLGCETLDRELADWDAYKGYLKPLGIKRIRLQGGWNKTEKTKGVYDFDWLDHIVDSAHELGLKVCLETSYGNKLYEPRAGLGPGGTLPAGEETLAAWDAWVEAMVRHYQPKGVDEWMMYNEPNLNRANTMDKIVAFNGRTAAVIKGIDPNAKIAGLVAAGLNLSLIEKWLKGLRDTDKLKHFEWVIYHGYGANPDSLAGGMEKLKTLVREYSPTIKPWQGEAGCASEEVQYALSGIDWSEISHAKWNARRMLCDFAHGIESTVFTISDLSYQKNFISRYGLLKTHPDNSLIKVKSAYYVVNNLVSIFNDDLVVSDNVRIESPPDRKLAAYAFKHKASDYDVIAVWDRSAIPVHECDLEYVNLSLSNLNVDDLVWVDLLSSRIYEVPEKRISRQGKTTVLVDVPIFDSPILLTDRSVLSYVKARVSKKRVAKKPSRKATQAVASFPMKSYRLFSTQKPAPAVIICHPDASQQDWTEKLAEALRADGVHAFIFTDRSRGVADAVSHVRSQAVEWQVNPEQVGILGQGMALSAYNAFGADFAVVIQDETDANLQKDTNVKMLRISDSKEALDENSGWLRDLLTWLAPRKTAVF